MIVRGEDGVVAAIMNAENFLKAALAVVRNEAPDPQGITLQSSPQEKAKKIVERGDYYFRGSGRVDPLLG